MTNKKVLTDVTNQIFFFLSLTSVYLVEQEIEPLTFHGRLHDLPSNPQLQMYFR